MTLDEQLGVTRQELNEIKEIIREADVYKRPTGNVAIVIPWKKWLELQAKVNGS